MNPKATCVPIQENVPTAPRKLQAQPTRARGKDRARYPRPKLLDLSGRWESLQRVPYDDTHKGARRPMNTLKRQVGRSFTVRSTKNTRRMITCTTGVSNTITKGKP